MQNDPNYINSLRRLPPHEYKAKVEGDWWVFAGQVFDEWRESRISGEPPHAIHVCEPFFIPDWWPKILAIDWGGINPDLKAHTWAGWFAVAPKNRVFLYREYSAKEKIAVWGADIARLSTGEQFKRIVLDPSAWAQRGDDHTIAEQFIQASGLRLTSKANNDRIGGKQVFHEYLRWMPKPARYVPPDGYSEELAVRIFRAHGYKGLNEYKAMFRPEPDEGPLPKLQVFKFCHEIIETIPKLVYNDAGKAGKNPEDVREFDGDDPYDGCRYGLVALDNFMGSVDDEASRRDEQSKIVEQLAQTGDWTTYHRRMEAFERKNTPVTGVRLYHKGKRSRYSCR